MKRTILFTMVFAFVTSADIAYADFTFGTPTNLGPTVNSTHDEWSLCISPDGLELFFDSYRPGGSGGWDIWVTTRATTNEPWGDPVNLGPTVNSPAKESFPCISSDGLSLFLESTRPGGYGNHDLWVTMRPTVSDLWGPPVNLGLTVNGSYVDATPSISADGLSLFFESNRPGGYGEWDLWVTTRASISDPWEPPVNLGLIVNTPSFELTPIISADGLLLFFCSDRPGGFSDYDLWVTRRKTKDDDWDTPVNLGPIVNSSFGDGVSSLSADGSTLYFLSNRPGGVGGYDIWQVSIEPVVDLNGDGIVDAADMCIIVDHWGENYPLCDIGPMPFGDGIVDVQDLIVLAEHLFEGIPPVEPEEVNVNEEDADSQVELEQGRILVVTLESNPTTGYRWEQVESQESILEQMGEAEFKPSETGGPPLVGAGGWEIFRFKALSAGQMTLQLVYHRPWEEGVEPLKTFSLHVVVR